MTRPVFATIGIMAVAVMLVYSAVYMKSAPKRTLIEQTRGYETRAEVAEVEEPRAETPKTVIDEVDEENRYKTPGTPDRSTATETVASKEEFKDEAILVAKVDDMKAREPLEKINAPRPAYEEAPEVREELRSLKPLTVPKKKARQMTSELGKGIVVTNEVVMGIRAGGESDFQFEGIVAMDAAPPRRANKEKRDSISRVDASQAMSSAPLERNVLPREYSGRDRFERVKPSPVKLTTEEPVSTFSIDVDTASYSFVRRSLNQGHLPQKDSVRVEELINYFDYDYETPRSRTKPFRPTMALYPTPWNKATRLLHIGIKGHDIEAKDRPRANLVFLIDVSGSMSSPDKLPLLKNSLKLLVGELEPEDTVAIAVYAGAAGTVLEPTAVKDKARIISALDRLQSGGSTAGGAGIRLAYSLAEGNFDKDAANRVILATDGDFNVGIRNPDELKGFVERKRKTGVFLSVLGFGQGNYNDELMQKLAQNGNGNAAYIDSLNEARKVLVEEAGSTLFTIARDVKIQIEFNPARVSEYRLIGYETRMLRREDFNNDKKDAGDVGAGHSVTAIYEITPVGNGQGLIDPLRYDKKERPAKVSEDKVDKDAEYAFLRLRYKIPGEEKSRLIESPINAKLEYSSIEKAPADMRFAAAVAAFGQILKGGAHTGGFSYDDVIRLAEDARGTDTFGYRSEFLNLVRLARTASDMGER